MSATTERDPGDLSCQPGWREACASVNELNHRLSVLMANERRGATVSYVDQPVPGGPLTHVVVSCVSTVGELERFAEGLRAAIALNGDAIARGEAAMSGCGSCGGTGRTYVTTDEDEEPSEDYCGCGLGRLAADRDAAEVILRAGGAPVGEECMF